MSRQVKENKSPYKAVITGYGSFVPEKKITNDDLAQIVDTSDEWITTRTGIKTRHISNDHETTAHLATEAAKNAIKQASLQPEDIELIIVATITPEVVFPSTACFVQNNIGAKNAWAFDLSAACSGFLYALSTAQQFLEMGRYKTALIIGAETLSKITNWKDRTSCVLFGDGAGAVIIERSQDPQKRGIIHSVHASDGSGWDMLTCKAYGSRYPADKPLEDPNMVYMEINGRLVYQQAVRRIVETVEKCLDDNGYTLDDIDMFISHQMNARIIESAAKRLNLPEEKTYININEYGNTSAASVPIAFDEAARNGKLKPGDLVIFVAFGAGLTWAATLFEF